VQIEPAALYPRPGGFEVPAALRRPSQAPAAKRAAGERRSHGTPVALGR
jgi:hypothetical protein